jgi:hypothetical protein
VPPLETVIATAVLLLEANDNRGLLEVRDYRFDPPRLQRRIPDFTKSGILPVPSN